MTKLIDILPEDLKEGLTPAEKEALEKAPIGKEADFRVGDKEKDNPANADQWDETRTIRAEFLYWLCTDEDATKLVHAKGIGISGVKIHETLDFECAHLRRRLGLFYSAIPEGIQLMDATTRTLAFSGSHTGPISAGRLKTEGSVFLEGARVKGKVYLSDASIDGILYCEDAAFDNPKGFAFIGENLRVGGALFLRQLENLDGVLNLRAAHIGQLLDDNKSWPQKAKLLLDGFEYAAFVGDKTPRTARARLKWLRLQPDKPFHPQPYEQLAKVLRRIGHEADVRKVLIAKQNDLRKYGDLGRLAKLRKWLSRWTIGYGYQPWISLIYIAVFVLAGWYGSYWAHEQGILQPSKEQVYMDSAFAKSQKPPTQYPDLQPLIYSLDVFLPIVDLHQESYWLPDITKPPNKRLWGRPWGYWFRIYFWVHIGLGWIFSYLAVASFTGLVRRQQP